MSIRNKWKNLDEKIRTIVDILCIALAGYFFLLVESDLFYLCVVIIIFYSIYKLIVISSKGRRR